jgi:hypothetical protein
LNLEIKSPWYVDSPTAVLEQAIGTILSLTVAVCPAWSILCFVWIKNTVF